MFTMRFQVFKRVCFAWHLDQVGQPTSSFLPLVLMRGQPAMWSPWDAHRYEPLHPRSTYQPMVVDQPFPRLLCFDTKILDLAGTLFRTCAKENCGEQPLQFAESNDVSRATGYWLLISSHFYVFTQGLTTIQTILLGSHPQPSLP